MSECLEYSTLSLSYIHTCTSLQLPAVKYDPQYALRLCTEHEQTRACVLIYAAMGLYEESVDHALSVSEDTTVHSASHTRC